MNIIDVIEKLFKEHNASKEELLYLLNNINDDSKDYLLKKSHATSLKVYGNKVYMRGLIEFTNYCIRNCKYCGIRKDNVEAERYRLSKDEIIDCAILGDKLGYKTYVLQGGEDPYFTDEIIVDIIKEIKRIFPSNAITLSIGEKSFESYKKFYEAGADRYLLRHETASKELYESLHPMSSFENRINCLYNLKEIGYQVGAGFMVGLPKQTNSDIVEDLIFLKKLDPEMVGIGPFIPHKDTPLANESSGTLEKTIILLGILRLLLPEALLPATTSLGTIHKNGRELGLKAGGNVVMPNLSPTSVREKYSLYDGKICTGDEAAECRNCIERRINNAGFVVEITRGDNIKFQEEKIWYL